MAEKSKPTCFNEYKGGSQEFKDACASINKPATKRQWKKWTKKRGIAYKTANSLV